MEQIWFALGCTSPRHELKVRDDARRYGLSAFVPLKYEVRKVRGREQRMLVPAITKLVFVKGTLEEVQDYLAHAHYVVYIQRSTFSNHKDFLTVPTRAMEDFIAVTEHHEEHVTYFNPQEIRLNVGDQIRVKGGLYDGREGIIMRIKGKRNRHLVVQIPGILIAAIEMSPDMIELVTMGSGTNAAHPMGTVVPDPSVTQAESRLRKAIAALKPSSFLRTKCQLYLGVLSHDEALLQQLQALFATWRKSPLSPNQRTLIDEYTLLVS